MVTMTGEQVFIIAVLALVGISTAIQSFIAKKNGALSKETIKDVVNEVCLLFEYRTQKRAQRISQDTVLPATPVPTNPVDAADELVRKLQKIQTGGD